MLSDFYLLLRRVFELVQHLSELVGFWLGMVSTMHDEPRPHEVRLAT